jgi:GNAT superfamily N-acetyltransferase
VSANVAIRAAVLSDVAALRTLIQASVRQLSVGYLTQEQIEAELRYVITPDTQLIADGTYFVAELPDGTLAAAGGWSRRRALHGGDAFKAAHPDANAILDPASEPARIRAMFTHPRFVRRGLARRIFELARDAAAGEGFRSLILTATMPGVPLYQSLGFTVARRYDDPLPDGSLVPVAEMTMEIS